MNKKNLGKLSYKIALFMLVSNCAFTSSVDLVTDQESSQWKWGDVLTESKRMIEVYLQKEPQEVTEGIPLKNPANRSVKPKRYDVDGGHNVPPKAEKTE